MTDTSNAFALTEVRPGVFAYVHETGTWGFNNAGLIVKGASALLVDTLFDMDLTGEMLQRMGRAMGEGVTIGTVVNTHGNGDHWYGNGHFADCEIISTKAAADEMRTVPPKVMRALMGLSRVGVKLGPFRRLLGAALSPLGAGVLGAVLEAAPYLKRIFGTFEFSGIAPVYPSRTFTDQLTVTVGDRPIELISLGPAHTKGDAVVFDPETKVLFSGDLLFMGAHPLVWAGPFSHWIAGCDAMMALKPAVVVPGHGPLTDVSGIEETRAYLVYMEREIRKCHQAGLSEAAAVRTLDLGPYGGLNESERVAVNVETLYRELNGAPARRSIVPSFPKMAALAAK